MRFNRLDLNLLVALDALLVERSITKAAERLNLSPSATSNALSRLREYFDDELLVQVGRRMEPTPRAQGLHDAVRDVLVRVDSAIAIQPQFDPATSDRVFRIFVSDYTQMVLAPHVLAMASAERCSARFEFLPQVSNPVSSLERGEADLLILPRDFLSPDHPEEVLYREEFVCVVWADGKLAKGELSFERYLAAGHVVMQPTGSLGESFEAWFVKRLWGHETGCCHQLRLCPAAGDGRRHRFRRHRASAARAHDADDVVDRIACPAVADHADGTSPAVAQIPDQGPRPCLAARPVPAGRGSHGRRACIAGLNARVDFPNRPPAGPDTADGSRPPAASARFALGMTSATDSETSQARYLVDIPTS